MGEGKDRTLDQIVGELEQTFRAAVGVDHIHSSAVLEAFKVAEQRLARLEDKVAPVSEAQPDGLDVAELLHMLDECTGVNKLIDINVEQPGDYALVLADLIRKAKELDQLERTPPWTEGMLRVAAERKRQFVEEGYDAEHDFNHVDGELARAAAAYAMGSVGYPAGPGTFVSALWPWDGEYRSSADSMRMLEKAGALIVAELDRLHKLKLGEAAQNAI